MKGLMSVWRYLAITLKTPKMRMKSAKWCNCLFSSMTLNPYDKFCFQFS